MNDAIEMLFKACVRGQCFPGIQPQADGGSVSIHQILDGLGLIDTSEATVHPQEQSKSALKPERDHTPMLTPVSETGSFTPHPLSYQHSAPRISKRPPRHYKTVQLATRRESSARRATFATNRSWRP